MNQDSTDLTQAQAQSQALPIPQSHSRLPQDQLQGQLLQEDILRSSNPPYPITNGIIVTKFHV